MLFSKSPKPELVFLIEIQSSAVRGSLVLFSTGQNPNILFTAYADMPVKPGTTSAYLVKTTLKAVSEAIDMLSRQHHAMLQNKKEKPDLILPSSVSSVHYVLSSPWIISQAKTVSLKLPKEGPLTRAKVLETIESERTKLSTEETQTEIVEEKIFDVRINGYPVIAWENRIAKDVDISFIVSLSGANLSQRLREACERLVNKRRVYFHSALLLEALGIGIVVPEAQSFTVVNIHGELTEVSVVREKRCIFFGSYPTGVDTIVRKVAKAGKTDDKAADSLLSLLASDSLDPTHSKPLQPMVTEVMSAWAAEFGDISLNAVPGGAIPTQIYVAARRHEEIFIRTLSLAAPKTQVTSLAIDRLLSHITYDAFSEHRRSTGLMVIAINSLQTE